MNPGKHGYEECPNCGTSGVVEDEICPKCKGQGLIKKGEGSDESFGEVHSQVGA